jgi:hypothetical protein
MDITTILNQIITLDIQDRVRLLQAIIISISAEKDTSNITESQQWQLDPRISLDAQKKLYGQIFALDIQDRMLLGQGISTSIAPEQVKSDIPESQQLELYRLQDLEDQKTPYGQVALTFVTALVDEKFEDAYILLSPSIQDDWPPKLLKDTYEGMVEYFGDLPVNYISIGAVDTSLPEDCWVYVEIACDGCGEAVTVTIKAENEKYLIQKIEWGRP